MRLTLRTKLMSSVAITGLAFLLVILAGTIVAHRVQAQLSKIQETYLPKVELEPELTGHLERIGRGFQDAVASRDLDALAATHALETTFDQTLAAAAGALDAADALELKASVAAYFEAGYDVSRRIIGGETGEALVDAIVAMQAKQTQANRSLKHTVALDRRELAGAFATTSRAARVASLYQMWIGIACLLAVTALSLWISRGVLRSQSQLTLGFARFGVGDFSQRIKVVGRDELAEVAQRANQMAESLERLGRERNRAETALKVSNQELEAFSYSVAHDLRAPLRGIHGFSRLLVEDFGDQLSGQAKAYLERITSETERMGQLIDALLSLARVSRVALQRTSVDVARVAEVVVKRLRVLQPERSVEFINAVQHTASGDPVLLQAVLENLIGNAWKFTGTRPDARITVGSRQQEPSPIYFIEDNGAGFDMAYADKLFAPFQRLHKTSEFAGTGIGLATVQRIISRHGGRIWAEGVVDRGATFYFTLNEVSGGLPQ